MPTGVFGMQVGNVLDSRMCSSVFCLFRSSRVITPLPQLGVWSSWESQLVPSCPIIIVLWLAHFASVCDGWWIPSAIVRFSFSCQVYMHNCFKNTKMCLEDLQSFRVPSYEKLFAILFQKAQVTNWKWALHLPGFKE